MLFPFGTHARALKQKMGYSHNQPVFFRFYIGTLYNSWPIERFWSNRFPKKLRINSAAGPTIDSKCEPSSQTGKSKRTSMRQYSLCDLQFKEIAKLKDLNFSFTLKLEKENSLYIYFWYHISTYRGDLEDTSSVTELHTGGVDCGQSSRVQVLPNQRPLKALNKKQTFQSCSMVHM